MVHPAFCASCHHRAASVFVTFAGLFLALRTSPRSFIKVSDTEANGSASTAGVGVSVGGLVPSGSFEGSTGVLGASVVVFAGCARSWIAGAGCSGCSD